MIDNAERGYGLCPSVPRGCIFLELNCFSVYNASQQSEKYIAWCQVIDQFLPYKFLLLRSLDFFGGNLLFHLF